MRMKRRARIKETRVFKVKSTHFDSIFTSKLFHLRFTVLGIKLVVAISPALCVGGFLPSPGMNAGFELIRNSWITGFSLCLPLKMYSDM